VREREYDIDTVRVASRDLQTLRTQSRFISSQRSVQQKTNRYIFLTVTNINTGCSL